MTEIVLVRHGETEWNVTDRFRGRMDIELNSVGIRQAELLSDYLKTWDIEAVYASPLKRTLKTAEIIAEPHGVNVKKVSGLIDFSAGEWEGLSVQEVKEKYGGLFAAWVSHPEKVKIPKGESLDEVTVRAMAVVAEVIRKHKGIVIMVSHRVVNKVLICALLGLDNSHFWNIKQDNCGITIFSHEGGRFVLTRHNDTSFLEPLKKQPLKDF
jgi:broad specificity phosphatase PhoE